MLKDYSGGKLNKKTNYTVNITVCFQLFNKLSLECNSGDIEN